MLRFDGLYAAPDEGCTGFLRFYASGDCLQVSVVGGVDVAARVADWLVLENAAKYSHGRYQIEGNVLAFDTTSAYGVVRYLGIVAAGGEELCLHCRSLINGNESYAVWRFVPL